MARFGQTKLDKNSIYFRFASEGNGIEKMEFFGKEIAVGDLKQQIAEEKRLPKPDLVLVNEATKEVYSRDGAMLPRNITVLVRRCPTISRKRPSVLHVENVDVWDSAPDSTPAEQRQSRPDAVPIPRKSLPPEYLCPVCRSLFDDPRIALCCGRSACSRCFARHAGESCPLCGQPCAGGSRPVPNPRLAASVSSLDLRYFILPGCKEEPGAEGSAPEAPEPPPAPAVPARPPAPLPGEGGALAAAQLAAQAAQFGGMLAQPPGALGWPPAGPPPAGLAPAGLPAAPPLQPCMLSAEQFRAWQQSVSGARRGSRSRSRRRRRRPEGGASDDASSRGGRKLKKRKSKAAVYQ